MDFNMAGCLFTEVNIGKSALLNFLSRVGRQSFVKCCRYRKLYECAVRNC